MSKRPPSVKGSLFQIPQAHLQALLERGRITREELAVQLSPAQIGLVDEKVQVALWYPIEAFNAFLRITTRASGSTSPTDLAAAGRAAASQLAESGLYAQMTEGTVVRHVFAGRRLVTLASAFYNFMHWEFVASDDPSRFRIEVTDAAAWCEELRRISEGFIEAVASLSMRRPLRITSERVAADHVVFYGHPAD